MQFDFTFWWSVVSTIISIVLAGFSIWQYAKSKNQQEVHISQVKVWMQQANGLCQALQRIVRANKEIEFTKVSDLIHTLNAIEATSFALYQSLYEERCVIETEYREEQKQMRKNFTPSSQKNN